MTMLTRSYAASGYVLWALLTFLCGCHRSGQQADIPDIQDLYNNLNYLDSVVRSAQIDSIGTVNDNLTATIAAYAHQAPSPEDIAILDSLTSINAVVNNLMQFCNNTLTNIELLKQDIKAQDNQYRSGKIKINEYVSALLETEQIIIDIDSQYTEKRQRALLYLSHRSDLITRLSPLTIP